jgi:hypothetical protein
MPRWEVWSADETALLALFGPGGYPYLSASIRADRNADCRYAATLVVPNKDGRFSQDETNPSAWIFAENNILKCFADDGKPLFYGLIDDATEGIEVGGIPTIQVRARSIEKKLIQECFTDTTAYIDTPSESANFAASSSGATATASSYVKAGDQLQTGARIIQVSGRKQVLGVWQDITPPQDARAIIDGSIATKYIWNHSENGLGALELTIRLDLWTPEGIQKLEAILEGNTQVFSIRTSQDGYTWVNQPNPAYNLVGVRFIEITFRATGIGSVSLEIAEVQILSSGDYPASALDDDVFTSWRPRPDDLERSLTINFGQNRTFNAIYLHFGVNPLDVWDSVKFKLYAGDKLIYDGTDKWYSGLVEVALANAITASSIKIRITARAGLTAIRYVEVLNVTANQNRVSWLLSDLATHAGIPTSKQNIPISWLWRANLTAQIGDTYWQHVKEVAGAVGWEIYGNPDGILKAGPVMIDASHPKWTISIETASITGIEKQPPQDIRNHIIVISEQTDKTIRGEAKDDSINSPTAVQRLGNRVQVITDNTITAQKAANQRALLELWQRARWKAGLRLTLANAKIIPDIGEIVKVEYPSEKIDGVYLVSAYTLDIEPGRIAVSDITLVPVG